MAPQRPVELARCDDHGLVLLEDDSAHRTYCAACDHPDVEVRLDQDLGTSKTGSKELTHAEFRNRMEADTVRELVPLMQEYLDDRGAGPMFFTHLPWDDALPAGYTEQERFVLSISYEWSAMVKQVITDGSARDTITTLRDAGYGGGDGQ